MAGKVIINLDKLFQDDKFNQYCESNRSNISNYSSGIGHYKNSENEIVLEIDRVSISQTFCYGSFSSPRIVLATKLFGHNPTPDELKEFDRLATIANVKIGGCWIKGEVKDRCIAKHIFYSNLLNSSVGNKYTT